MEKNNIKFIHLLNAYYVQCCCEHENMQERNIACPQKAYNQSSRKGHTYKIW